MNYTRERLYNIDKRKTKKGLCGVRYCSRRKLKGQATCSRCKHARRKLNDPLGYTYDILKQNARKRRKEFTITKEYFRKICEESGYLEAKGQKSNSLSLDRINPIFGYIPGNIRVINLGLNSSRKADDYDYDPSEDLPF